MNKNISINYSKVVLDAIVSLFLASSCIYAAFYFHEVHRFGDVRYFFLCATLFLVRLIALLSSVCLKIEFEQNILIIHHLFFRKKIIDFSTIKDFSVTQGFQNIDLYYIDNQKPVKIILKYFEKADKAEIADNIAEIMHGYFVNYSEEQLDKFYVDKTQYDFTATEKHNPIVLGLILFVGFLMFVTVLAVLLTLFVIKPKEGLFSVIEEWFIHFNLISIIVVYLLDIIVTNKTLECKNGVISLCKSQKIIHTVNADDIYKYSMDFKEFAWKTKQNPKKENVINLMGFSRKDKKELRNKLTCLIH